MIFPKCSKLKPKLSKMFIGIFKNCLDDKNYIMKLIKMERLYAYVQIIILAKLNCLVDVEWSCPVGEGILSCCCCWLHADMLP